MTSSEQEVGAYFFRLFPQFPLLGGQKPFSSLAFNEEIVERHVS